MAELLETLAGTAVDAARRAGADYADVRAGTQAYESLATYDEKIDAISAGEGQGIGLRILKDGHWGFAGTDRLDEAAASGLATAALAAARAAKSAGGPPSRFTPAPPATGRWDAPVRTDPFAVPREKKLELLFAAARAMHAAAKISRAKGNLNFSREEKFFASTAGHALRQSRTVSGGGLSAIASGGDDYQTRSYPAAFGGDYAAAGWEFVEAMRLADTAPRCAEESVALLTAAPCPEMTTDLILGSSQLALQVHESCGHATELDRALGWEVSLAGSSFLTPDKRGNFQYGSKLVNLTADSTLPGSIGSFGWDDEGSAARRTPLIAAGRFENYLGNLETSAAIGAPNSACMRAESPSHLPIIRMINVSLEPGGAGTLADLIADTKDGIFIDTNRSWSIDDRRVNFQFSCEYARRIENGKLTTLYKNPLYTGITPKFWGSLDAICGASDWKLWGIPNCGKGDPMQTMGVGHGAAPARFRGVTVRPAK
jgi:TldD protein